MDASTVDVSFPAAAPANTPATSAANRPVPAVDAANNTDGEVHFSDVLSALNPLQYLPVVGTIYRAVTGDVIPEGLRIAGSFVVSALTGGPLGMAINVATTAAEKITGIDPEAIAREVATDLGLTGTRKPGGEQPQTVQAGTPAIAATEPSRTPAADLDDRYAAVRLAALTSYARVAQA